MTDDATSALVDRARRAQAGVEGLALDERLARTRASRACLAAVGDDVVRRSTIEAGRPVKFARRELETALQFIDALPELADAIRSRRVPAVSGSTTLEFRPYGVVLGWHAANAPIWVPALVALSALVGGNALLARPSQRTLATSTETLRAIAEPWPADAVSVLDLPWNEAEELIAAPGIDAIVAHSSTETCKRHLGLLGAAYASGSARLSRCSAICASPRSPRSSGRVSSISDSGGGAAWPPGGRSSRPWSRSRRRRSPGGSTQIAPGGRKQ
ncbi:MAG: aldehyde dehydrogenase family protein, partial [Firmicutes bacterium]|nr:aldehyde dehydrogenase family protein [Bacillota bacterium]